MSDKAENDQTCVCYKRVPDLLPTHDCNRVQSGLARNEVNGAWWWSTRLGRQVTDEEARSFNEEGYR